LPLDKTATGPDARLCCALAHQVHAPRRQLGPLQLPLRPATLAPTGPANPDRDPRRRLGPSPRHLLHGHRLGRGRRGVARRSGTSAAARGRGAGAAPLRRRPRPLPALPRALLLRPGPGRRRARRHRRLLCIRLRGCRLPRRLRRPYGRRVPGAGR
jgi:hypothetical protein